MESSENELRKAIEAIKSSDVVENRAELIIELGDLDITNKCGLSLLVENLIAFWEDYTCLDVSQCNLNKAILQVASKYLRMGRAGIWAPFLVLGNKASIWSRKHLKMTLMSLEESQEEEHCNIFYLLLLDLLNFSATTFSALTHSFSSEEKMPVDIVKVAILEQLDLIKDSLPFIKPFQSFCPQVLKTVHMVIDSVVKLCEELWHYKNHDDCRKDPDEGEGSMEYNGATDVNPIMDISKSTVQKLSELGILAANDGGSLVNILNVSWKGVVTLLQQGKGEIEATMNVSDIILKLVSLANNSLRCAAESWSISLKEPIAVAEARRTFIPVKFYLVNAVKISSLFPFQAYLVHREISQCALMISNLRISMSKEYNLKIASEVVSELLELTTIHLLYTILNSNEVKPEMKFEVLEWLFADQGNIDSVHEVSYGNDIPITLNDIFSANCEELSTARTLHLGRILLFICFLRYSLDLEEDAKLGIARKLRWLFDMLVDDKVYSCVLAFQVPIVYGAKQTAESVWELMLFTLLHSLKTFMIVVSSSIAWKELESFMLENFFHPHFLCLEIIMELFCFLVRYAEMDVANEIIDKLCSCFKLMICSKSILGPRSAPRKMARSICKIIKCAKPLADRVHSHAVAGDKSQFLSIILVCLLMEGFSLNLLSDKLGEITRKKIISDYCCFMGNFDENLLGARRSSFFGAPILALSASLPSLDSAIDERALKFLAAILESYWGSADDKADHCIKLLGETLSIISYEKKLYACNGMEEVILQLHRLFISKVETRLHKRKANLAVFMAGLGHMEMAEADESIKSSAVWQLYHMLLRERHWALIHVVLTAFGYFAARTSCNQLWRFVPADAALCYDLSMGNEASEERFMSEFKAFLEKEMAFDTSAPSSKQLQLLEKEAAMLRAAAAIEAENVETVMVADSEMREVDEEQAASKRRRILPDGISKGVELLQSGLEVFQDGLSQWQWKNTGSDSSQLHDKFLTHFSCLKDVITNLASIANAGGDY